MPGRSSPASALTEYKVMAKYEDETSTTLQPNTISSEKWVNSVTFGENIPGWRENLRNGLSATTSMTGSNRTVQVTNGLMTFLKAKVGLPDRLYVAYLSGAHGCQPTSPTGDPATMDYAKANALALGKFGRRIVEVNTSFQGGVFLGELAQTIRTIKNPAQGLRKLVDDWRSSAQRIRRLSSRQIPGSLVNRAGLLRRTTANLADAWLETQYGWRPLLNDVDNGCRALADYNAGQSLKTKRISSRSTVDGPTADIGTDGYANSFAIWRVQKVTTSHQTVIYRGAMRVEARDPQTMDAELLGFNPGSWLPTAWELMPYSFLIDYFSNVGDIINGWSTLTTRLAWCNRTIRRQYVLTSTSHSNLALVKANVPTVTSVTVVPAKVIATKRSVLREKYTGTFVPGLQFEVPGLGSLKWLNIAALIAARRSDRKWSYGD